MKKTVLTTLVTMISASAAFAGDVIVPTDVPEAGATGSLAALAAVAAVGAITWERRRRPKKPD